MTKIHLSTIFILSMFMVAGCQHNTETNDSLSFQSAKKTKENKKKIIIEQVPIQMEGQLKPLDKKEPEKLTLKSDMNYEDIVQGKNNTETIIQPMPLAVPSKKNSETLSKKERKQIYDLAKRAVSAPDATALAKRKARVAPSKSPEGWINAITVFEYMEGALYQVFASPGNITDVMLQPGEVLISQSAGDTLRWRTGVTHSGIGNKKRNHIQIKPKQPGIKTNMIINTNKRVYYIELTSTKNKSYMASCSWSYSDDSFIEMYQSVEKENEISQNKIIVPNLEDLNFDYDIIGKQSWKPIRVFDNGQKTYIQFPSDMKHRAAPVLFVANSQNIPQLVNYRKLGDYYVVDRLFEYAELRHGQKKQSKVRIKNNILSNTEYPKYSKIDYPGNSEDDDFNMESSH